MSTRQVSGSLCSLPLDAQENLVNLDDLDRCLRAALSTSPGLRDVIVSGASGEVTYPCSSEHLSQEKKKGDEAFSIFSPETSG